MSDYYENLFTLYFFAFNILDNVITFYVILFPGNDLDFPTKLPIVDKPFVVGEGHG